MQIAQTKRGYKFDFDSDSLVEGERFAKPAEWVDTAVEYSIAFAVVALGAWLCRWWWYGGFHTMNTLFWKYAWWIMNLLNGGGI